MSENIKDLNYYLGLPYSYKIEWSDPDNCYLGSILELEENMTHGETPDVTLRNLKEALESYVMTSLENNFEIPEPVKKSDFKGNIPYRTDPETHYKLHKKALTEKKSINKIIDEIIKKEIA